MKSKPDRIEWIDIYKGIAIILVVIGHLEIPDQLYRVIFSFHLYAFFLIGGVTFRSDTPFSQVINKSVKSLYLPYLLFGLLWDVFHTFEIYVLNHSISFHPADILFHIIGLLVGKDYFGIGLSIGPAWFLCCLLVVRILYKSIAYITSYELQRFVMCSILFIIGYMLNNISFMPFFIIQALSGVWFFAFGVVLQKYIYFNISFHGNKFIYSMLIMFISFLCNLFMAQFSSADLVLVSNSFPDNPFIMVLGALSGCLALLLFSINFTKMGGYLYDYILFLGRNSLIVMGTHSEIHHFFRYILQNIGLSKEETVVPVFIITMVLSWPISKIFKKIPFL